MIFEKTADGYRPEARLKPRVPLADSFFGQELAFADSCSHLVVGVPAHPGPAAGINANEGGTSSRDSGAIYLFSFQSAWRQSLFVKPPGNNAGDRFGHSVAIDTAGLVLAVGSPYEDGSDTGVRPGPQLADTADSVDHGRRIYLPPRQSHRAVGARVVRQGR